MYDDIIDSNPLVKKLMMSGSYKSIDGGTTIDVPLNYALATNGWFQGSDTLSTADVENITAASFTWKSLYAAITLSDEDELKNSGTTAALNLLKAKTEIAKRTMKDSLGTGVFSDGSDSKSIVGLESMIATGNTIGGLSQSTNAWWQSQIDSSTTTLSISAMNAIDQSCSVDNERPNLAVSTRTLYNSYYSLLQPAQRFMDAETAKAGFTSLMFNGYPLLSDSHCTTNYMYFLNLNHLFLFYHPKRNFSMEEWQKPINQQVRTNRVLWMGAMGSSNLRLQGALTAVTA